MTRLPLLITLLTLPLLTAHAQEPDPPEGARINSAQVSGFDLSRLSPGLQEEIGKLAGSPLTRQRLRELAARIEAEQPRFIAGVRADQNPDGGVRIVFVVARMPDQRHEANINALTVFADPLARIFDDPDHSNDEVRELIIGHSTQQHLLIVSFTERA